MSGVVVPLAMPTRSERNALWFLASVALIGAGVRTSTSAQFVRSLSTASQGSGGRGSPKNAGLGAAALASQIEAVDSARSARAAKAKPPRKSAAGSSSRARSSSDQQLPKLPRRKGQSDTPVVVNVNSASASELERLPRVGPALAARIIAWREQHGPFRSVEDLRHVRGIGPRTATSLTPMVTF